MATTTRPMVTAIAERTATPIGVTPRRLPMPLVIPPVVEGAIEHGQEDAVVVEARDEAPGHGARPPGLHRLRIDDAVAGLGGDGGALLGPVAGLAERNGERVDGGAGAGLDGAADSTISRRAAPASSRPKLGWLTE